MTRFKIIKDPKLDAPQRRGRPRNQDGRKTRVASLWVAIVDQEHGAKVREVERMGFGNVKHIPNWKVNQPLLVALPSSYDRNSKSLVVSTRKILIMVELITRCSGFPNHGESYKAANSPEDCQLFKSLKNKTIVDLSADVKDWLAAQLDEKTSEEITRPSGLLNRAASRTAPSSSVSSSRRRSVKKKGTVEDNT
ncbi:hypothetical protein PIB30_024246 [Stylosanthes scabra]|uniref:Uncharacterized protein n=1 Tax=Stylosanthes scabra TaxID=79078 RepID=A0ABU6T9Y1_9FABA|nr:hypothetical protein [Stylosanthes scabra]